jgi:ribosome-binding protein aMBF1 (putative translation factor)
MIEPKTLSRIINYHRKTAGLSRLKLAELATVGKTVIFDLENGKETIQLDTLRKILRVLNIKVKMESAIMDEAINQEYEKS